MKVLWLSSVCPQFACSITGMDRIVSGGWLDQSGERIIENNHHLIVVCPLSGKERHFENDNLEVFSFSKDRMNKHSFKISDLFLNIIQETKPDIIHIHGTEFPHSYSMMEAAQKSGMIHKCVVSIQGLVSIYAQHYYAGLSEKIIHSYTFRDLFKGNIYRNCKSFEKRGEYEKQTLQLAKHIIGRTNWDKAITLQFNPSTTYHHNNESLRKAFYYDSWSYSNCEKHSIFVSQSSYPIKGFHIALEALSIVLKEFSDSKLYVTGISPFNIPFYKLDSYKKYLMRIIIEKGLKEHVVFTGYLDENSMKERFLRSNVFVMCSSIENSPNTLGEAMLLGVPTVASDVGGVSTMLRHETEGYIYPYDEAYMLAYYICESFKDKECIIRTENARQHARLTHNVDKNYNDLIQIYNEIRE